MKKFILVAAMVALISAPAFAAVQNVKVSGNLTTTAILDQNIPSAAVGNVDVKGFDIMAQTQLNVEADLTDNVSAKIGLLNERLWGHLATDANSGTSIDLETAYVTLKEFLYSPLTVTVGRQPLFYGNGLIIGQNNDFTANLPAPYSTFSRLGNFDALKAALNFDPVTVDVFASRIDNNASVIAPHGSNDNANLYGINAAAKLGDKMSTVVEGYIFALIDDTVVDFTGDTHKSADTYVPGLRVSVNPAEGLSVQLEGAYQTGKTGVVDTKTRDAYAFQGLVNFALPGMKDLSPVVSAEYKYLSGSANPDSGKNWNRMFEKQDNGRIFDQAGIGDSNLQLVKLGAEVTPIKDLTAGLAWYGLWKAIKDNSEFTATPASSKYLGSEVDADLTYAYTEDVKLGLSAGIFFTGKAVDADINKNAQQILTSVSVSF